MVQLQLPNPRLTYTESEVEQSHPDVKAEEKDNIGNFAEHEDVSYMLVHRNWKGEQRITSASASLLGPDISTRILCFMSLFIYTLEKHSTKLFMHHLQCPF